MFKFIRFSIVLCLMTVAGALWAKDLFRQEITSLKTMPVVKTTLMRDFLREKGQKVEFDNEVYLITLENGIKAVFKPVPADDLADAHAEVAAFKASEFLGFPKIPPTVLRKINGKSGSLQLYIEPTRDSPLPQDYEKLLEQTSPEEVANLKLFYFVFGQWDSGPHNIIIQEKPEGMQLFAIDNSGIKHRQYVQYGEVPFVRMCYCDKIETNDWHLPFPYEKAISIERPSLESLQAAIGGKVPEALLKNLSRWSCPLTYVWHKNSFWVQHHKADPYFVKAHTILYPEKSILKLKALNRKILNQIFSEAKGAEFLKNDFLNAILERRDQVVADYEKRKL